MRVIAIAVLLLATLTPTLVAAQPEDRRRAPTAEAANVDPCADAASPRPIVSGSAPPGFDPRVPAPQGATSFTGIAPPSRDPSRQLPLPPPTADVAYEDCRRRLGR